MTMFYGLLVDDGSAVGVSSQFLLQQHSAMMQPSVQHNMLPLHNYILLQRELPSNLMYNNYI